MALPWTLLVYAGTYAEFILPILVVIGLFGRLSALGMIGFIVVQSYVDVAFHGVEGRGCRQLGSIGSRTRSSLINGCCGRSRSSTSFSKGPACLSVDALLGRCSPKLADALACSMGEA